MIPFYRKIRKKLSDDNNFLKYSRYATGEILLVVIGILIALQINNWNENRRLRKVEVKLLRELHNDLLVTLDELEMDIPSLENQMKVADQLILYAGDSNNRNDSPQQFLDSFGFFAWNVKMYPRTIAYQNLKSMGFDLFSNDSIRYMTADMFDRRLTRIELWENFVFNKEELLIEKMADHFISYLYKEDSISDDGEPGRYLYAPERFTDLANNKSILNELANMQNNRQMQLYLYKDLKQVIVKLIRLIEEEVGRNFDTGPGN